MIKLFGIPIFLASILLFYIQPMVGKILLPTFGGSAGVWNACVLFFQISLLIGYIYAHLLTQKLSLKYQVATHLFLLVISLILLFSINNFSNIFASNFILNNSIVTMPQLQILYYLGLILALPMIIISATSPLIQKWYSYTDYTQSTNPYPLYSISNIANIFGLLAYLFILEPLIGINQQFIIWKFIIFIMLCFIMACSYILINLSKNVPETNSIKPIIILYNKKSTLLKPGKILYWLILSIIPASLLLSTTQIITTNVSPVPLLWIIPLVLYLLSFAIAFSRNKYFNLNILFYILPFTLPVLIYFPVTSTRAVEISLILAMFFMISCLCHYKLYRTRPHTDYLTNYYLVVSLGGIIGSCFNTFIAPSIFNDYYEFPAIIILAITTLLYKKKIFSFLLNNKEYSWCFVLIALLLFLPVINTQSYFVLIFCLAAIALFYYGNTAIFSIFTIVLCFYTIFAAEMNNIYLNRNFYGKQAVLQSKIKHTLVSGNTVHGEQYTNGDVIISYYRPAERLINSISQPLNIATVGLGTGTLACLKRPKDTIDFYEINPDMISIANNPNLFTYIKKCSVQNIILGDGRLKLSKVKDNTYDMIVFDAFTSGSIPIHLLTFEAIKEYLNKIKPKGILLFHTSNKYLDLSRALYSSAKKLSLNIYSLKVDKVQFKNEYASSWIVMFKDNSIASSIINKTDIKWQMVPETKSVMWTDDHNTILPVLRNFDDFI